MKLKKIAAALVAACVAVTSLVFTPVVASADDITLSNANLYGWSETTSISSGTVTAGAAWDAAAWWVGGTDHSRYTSVSVPFSDNTAGTLKLMVQYTNESTASEVTSSSTSGTLTCDLSEAGKAGGISQIAIQCETAGSFKVGDCTIKEDASAPEVLYNTWTTGADGNPTITLDGVGEYPSYEIALSNYTDLDYADIASISVTYATTGSEYTNGAIGLNDASGTWTTANWAATDTTVTLNVDGVEAGQVLQFQTYYGTDLSTVTIKNVTVQKKLEKHAINIDENIMNGSISCDKTQASMGETVTITAVPADGYGVNKITVNGDEITAKKGTYSFVMPDAPVTVSATFITWEEFDGGEFAVCDDIYSEVASGEDATDTVNETANIASATIDGSTLYIYKKVSLRSLRNANEISLILENTHTAGKKLKLRTTCAYNSINGTAAGDGYVYIAFVITNVNTTETTNPAYYGNLHWSDFSIS